MAQRQSPSRRAPEKRDAASKQPASRRAAPEKQTPPRRNDVIRCENCGEDYSITYKRCPFCDERPGRTGIGGRRVNDGRTGRGTVHPVQVVGLVVSMVIIIAALFIVFKYVGPLIFGDKSPASSSVSTSQSGSQSAIGSSSSQQGGDVSSGGDVSEPVPQVNVTSLTLNKSDITLTANEVFPFVATVTPADAPVTWTSSDESILKVEQDGTATNVNTTGGKVKVTVTATAGDKTAECTVYCNSAGGGSGTTTPSGTGGSTTTPSGGAVAPNTPGTIVNAGNGLNIRSGPGSSYEKIASAPNGAKIVILEDTGSGWYKIDYGNGQVGYVSSDYVSVGN